MTNHYAAPFGPPCRCAWCRSQQVQPANAGNPLVLAALVDKWLAEDANAEPPPLITPAPIRIANRQQAEQERRRLEAEELADWLAQDVH